MSSISVYFLIINVSGNVSCALMYIFLFMLQVMHATPTPSIWSAETTLGAASGLSAASPPRRTRTIPLEDFLARDEVASPAPLATSTPWEATEEREAQEPFVPAPRDPIGLASLAASLAALSPLGGNGTWKGEQGEAMEVEEPLANLTPPPINGHPGHGYSGVHQRVGRTTKGARAREAPDPEAAPIPDGNGARHPFPGCRREGVEGSSSATRGTATAKQPLVVVLEEGGVGRGKVREGGGYLLSACFSLLKNIQFLILRLPITSTV